MATLHELYGDKTTTVRYRTNCVCKAVHIVEFLLPERKSWFARIYDKVKTTLHQMSGTADEIQIPTYQPETYCPPDLDVDPPCLDENPDDVNPGDHV